MRASAPKTLVCEVQRFSLHDGPGIRSTIFFKGCPLRCRWCHNPETMSFAQEVMYSVAECIRCGDCVKACPEQALSMTGAGVAVDPERCQQCLRCTEVCPTEARAPVAKSYGCEELMAEVLRDRDFYGAEGGVTLSGGEPLVHVGFLRAFLQRVKEAGLHVVAETAGYWHYERVAPLLRYIDLLLYDLKVVNEAKHRELTSKGNRRILGNLRRLVSEGQPVQVRMPLVPGLNDSADDLRDAARLLRSIGLSSIVLLPYHPLGQSKLLKLASAPAPVSSRPPTREQLEQVAEVFADGGIAAQCG